MWFKPMIYVLWEERKMKSREPLISSYRGRDCVEGCQKRKQDWERERERWVDNDLKELNVKICMGMHSIDTSDEILQTRRKVVIKP